MRDPRPGATNVSGGVTVQSTGDVNVGRDVAGRDIISSTSFHLPLPLPPQPGFFYPTPSNAFVGRNALLQQLHQALKADGTNQTRPVVLVGMSGVGKTRLAIEYAHHYTASYPGGIYWIDFTRDWEDQVVKNAELLGLREYADRETERRRLLMLAFRNFLNTHPQSLLILDGVNDWPALAWSDPATGFRFAELRCRILITTHSDVIGLPFEIIPVNVLPKSEALELLLTAQALRRTEDDLAAARTICGMLGYLPLAVSIAAAFLKVRQDVSLSGYRNRLQRKGGLNVIDQTLGELRPLADYERAVGATLTLQWKALQNENARFVLQTIAWLGGHTWVTRAQLALLTNLPDEADSGYPVPLESALIPLRQLSLIEETSQSIHLHALIQEFVRQQISAEGSEEHLKDYIEHNLSRALPDATAAPDRVLAVSECLSLVPEWKPPRLREMIFEKLLQLMNDAIAPTLKRHRAARLLANLRWLDESWLALFPDTMLNYMEFIARTVDLDTEREHLEQRLSKLLDDQARIKLGERERAELLVFRAALRIQLGKPLDVKADYEEAWRLAGDTSDRLAARIKLGLANILAGEYEDLIESADLDVCREAKAGLCSAVVLYWEADKFMSRDGADAILHVIILKELAYVYALLDKWGLGRRRCQQALEIVQQIEDEDLRPIYLAWILETKSQILFKWGLHLQAGDDLQAPGAFATAYSIVAEEIEQLNQSAIENYDYVLAHRNAGEYLLEESRCSNCQAPRLPLAEEHLRHALEIARRLKITELVQDAERLLEAVTARQLQNARGKE